MKTLKDTPPLLEAYRVVAFHQTFKAFDSALEQVQMYAEEAHEAATDEQRARAEKYYNLAFDRVVIEYDRMEWLAEQWGIDMQPIRDVIDKWFT